MIKKNTVFVLGAGASQSYGFPSGPGLVDRICQQLQDPDGEGALILRSSGNFERDDLITFGRRLRESRLNSIDAFLQRRQEYAALGKAAVAQELLRWETDALLFPPREQDWYRSLFNQILPSDPDEFCTNQLKVITFNFDRSFEHALFRSLETLFDDPRKSFGGGRNRPVEMLAMLPVLHLHGQLGQLGFLPPSPLSRAYVPATDAETIAMCADQLKIVHDNVPDEDLQKAWRWLIDAEVVCFLGFGYHELNLARLDVRRTLRGKRILGTRLQLGEGAKSKASRWFERFEWMPPTWDIVKCLDENDVIHD